MSLWTLVIYISPHFFLCFICTLLIEEAKLWSHILHSVHCLSQHQWCTLPSSKSLRTWISCQFSMLWLLVKFPLPYILHGDRKELILISLMSSRMWCTARRCQKDTVEAKSSSSSLRCTFPLGLGVASNSFLQHQPGPAPFSRGSNTVATANHITHPPQQASEQSASHRMLMN